MNRFITLKRNPIYKSIVGFVKLRVLHLNDSPQRIAMGVALGLFIAWTPLLGFHMLLALALTLPFRANKAAAMTFVWVHNPITMFFVLYPNYLLGRDVLDFFERKSHLTDAQINEMFRHISFKGGMLANFFHIEFWRKLAEFFAQIGLELFVGGAIIGFFVALAGYFGTMYVITKYRQIHPHRHFQE